MLEQLSQNIMFLQGVGPKKAELLKKELDIETFEELLYYFPYKYVDRSKIFTISEIDSSMPHIQLKGKILSIKSAGEGRTKRLTAIFSDGTGYIELIWFKGLKYIQSFLKQNVEYIVFGKPTIFNNEYNIAHPEIEIYDESNKQIHLLGLNPAYNTSEKMKENFLNSKGIQKLVKNLLLSLKTKIPETLPSFLIEKYRLIDLDTALRVIHFPPDNQILAKARFRLIFEELFYIQLNILSLKNKRISISKGSPFPKVGDYLNRFYSDFLPFTLTDAQKRVIREIRHDLGSGKQMNRLLQGDVGSGKTLVAMMIMLIALDNDFQTCMMVPTEILSAQHFNTFKKMLEPLGVKVALLTGTTKKKERKIIHEGLENGEIQILIGTHALIEDNVLFKKLALIIIDEQHRFGVAQRSRLWKKSKPPPHVLVMTATPIPRTLAMTVYGDLDVSVIDEMPPGRKPVQTYHYYHNNRNSLNKFIRGQINNGRQVYVVFPLIEESEKMDFKNLNDGCNYMREAFPDLKVVIAHGRLKQVEKDDAMRQFVSGEANILVATTVIEVGVDVPNASVMIIESAERFGLSQLHQLRGRVGRGAEQSFCILMTSYKLGEESRKRMEIMIKTNDGFEIAEADMKIRGPGDLEGTQQSGLPFDLKIANLARDSQILILGRDAATMILDDDPLLTKNENLLLKERMRHLAIEKGNWGMIS
ncbi:MAG: ATP-dependent DNA helicase RecG [Marinilabiliaceae bacterium]|nr:ATP-dependent DNA helicase RecG [Marinilabiliaceae bacterium]